MKETLCSLELSKLSQEIGFSEPCRYCYHNEGKSLDSAYNFLEDEFFTKVEIENSINNGFPDIYLAPTLSQLQKYFREIHDLHICIDTTAINKNPSKGIWMYRIDNLEDLKGDYIYHSEDDDLDFKTYEEALEDALIQVCKIIKNEI